MPLPLFLSFTAVAYALALTAVAYAFSPGISSFVLSLFSEKPQLRNELRHIRRAIFVILFDFCLVC